MSIETVTAFLQQYGYIVIILTLFCGIVGIPAPEESFLVVIGVLAAKHQILLEASILSAWTGSMMGMLVSYGTGRWLGNPFIRKYGKFIKITQEKWESVAERFHRHGKWTIMTCLFIPGLRQLTPYIAGTSQYPLSSYTIFSVLGSSIWTVLFVLIGYFLGGKIDLKYIPFIAMAAFLIFVFALIKKNRSNSSKKDC